jgi:hypothetical protein
MRYELGQEIGRRNDKKEVGHNEREKMVET